jgi:hypothetical protein
MRLALIVAIVISVIVIVAMLTMKRPGPEHQVEPIDADHDPHPPSPEATRHMSDPPPGSRGDREQHGKP